MVDVTDQQGTLLAFDSFTLDLARGVLTAGAREVTLRPKTTAVLAHLLAHAGQVVSRDALLTAVWGDVAITDDSLTQCVSEIRRALGTAGAGVLETHARRGYRMATRLRPVVPAADPPSPPVRGPGPETGPETGPEAGPEASPCAATPPAETSAPASMRTRRRVAWTALAVGCCSMALSAAAWIGTDRSPVSAANARAAPAFVAAAPPSSGTEARQLLRAGWAALHGDGSQEARLRASLALYLRALELEPELAEAAAAATFAYANLRSIGASEDPERDLREAQRLAAVAQAASPKASSSLAAQATVLRQQRRFAEAIIFYERAGADPARIIDRANVGVMHLMLGAFEDAQPPLRAVLLENPRHEYSGRWRGYLGLAKLLAGKPAEAAGDFLTSSGPNFPAEERLLYRLVALHAAGRFAEAQTLDADLRQRHPPPVLRPLRALGLSDDARYRARFETAVLAPLRRIGWIEPGD